MLFDDLFVVLCEVWVMGLEVCGLMVMVFYDDEVWVV